MINKYGEILKLLRIVNDFSVKEEANMLSKASTYICDLESSRKNPSLEMLQKLSLIYNIPTYKIIEFHELKKQNYTRKQIMQEMCKYYIKKKNKKI